MIHDTTQSYRFTHFLTRSSDFLSVIYRTLGMVTVLVFFKIQPITKRRPPQINFLIRTVLMSFRVTTFAHNPKQVPKINLKIKKHFFFLENAFLYFVEVVFLLL